MKKRQRERNRNVKWTLGPLCFFVNSYMCVHTCCCVCAYQDIVTICFSESKTTINMPEASKCWQENIAEWLLCQRYKVIFKLNSFSTICTIQSYPNSSKSAVWTQQGTGHRTEQGKGLYKWKWRMGATRRSTPPPVLMEICQDPFTILSTAHNVWMAIYTKITTMHPNSIDLWEWMWKQCSLKSHKGYFPT